MRTRVLHSFLQRSDLGRLKSLEGLVLDGRCRLPVRLGSYNSAHFIYVNNFNNYKFHNYSLKLSKHLAAPSSLSTPVSWLPIIIIRWIWWSLAFESMMSSDWVSPLILSNFARISSWMSSGKSSSTILHRFCYSSKSYVIYCSIPSSANFMSVTLRERWFLSFCKFCLLSCSFLS